MQTAKNLGIWMDHASANLMEYSMDEIGTQTIESKFTHEVKEESIHKSESLEHHKEQHEQAGYYKQLGDIIKNYEHVLLFGPTDAKVELFNTLKADHHFDKIKIDVLSADKMTENQQHAFVREHFGKHHHAL
jgi:nitrogenase subunit NifH